MAIATTIRTHFGVTIDGEIKTFCGTDKIGAGETEDKFSTEGQVVNCGDCQGAIDSVARYALRNAAKLPKYVRTNRYRVYKW